MIIPLDELQPDTLTAIIEQFVLGEGTDYGEQVYSLQQKVAMVRRQLEKGEALLVYSELHDSVNIIPATTYQPDA
ncbi:MAG: YheU family protein [Gammaproteobacteria bacterium]|nr:YheU family protein [Gammaproteobacteria bacterium]